MSSAPPKTLNDACKFIVDCLHTTAPNQLDGYPLIRTPNVGFGRLDLTGVHRVSEEIYQSRIRRGVPQAILSSRAKRLLETLQLSKKEKNVLGTTHSASST